MAAWGTKLRQWWRGDEPDAGPAVVRTTAQVVPAADLTQNLTQNLTQTRLPPTTQAPQTAEATQAEAERRKALRAERVPVSSRKRRRKAPVSKGAEYQARYRDRLMAEDLEGYLHRKRVDEAARYARKKAEKDAQAAAQAPGQVGVSADVVDLQAVRAARTAEAPQVIEQIEQVDQTDREEIAG
jgi:hypothetical protein